MRRASIKAEIFDAERRASVLSIDERKKSVDADANNNIQGTLVDLTPESALDIVKPFFPNEWSKVTPKDVTLKIITGGFCNSISVISRQKMSSEDDQEPLSLLIRRKGGQMIDTDDLAMNTDVSQTLIVYEMSRRGLGPKLYGIFKGGSVEEFIDAHTLTSEEAADPEVSKDIALSLASVHAIQGLPLKRNASEEGIKQNREWMKMITKSRLYLENDETLKKYNLDVDFLINFKYDEQQDWLISKYKQLKMRKNFILNDMNYLNCLVRNRDPKDGERRVMLIDYDIGHYDYRGIDFGVHFFNRRVKYDAKEDKILKGATFPTEDEKRRFLKIYQQEIKRLNVWPDFDEDGIDSVDNMLIESLIGQCHYCLMFSCYMMAKPEIFFSFDPAFAPFLQFMLTQFLLFKEEIEKLISTNE